MRILGEVRLPAVPGRCGDFRGAASEGSAQKLRPPVAPIPISMCARRCAEVRVLTQPTVRHTYASIKRDYNFATPANAVEDDARAGRSPGSDPSVPRGPRLSTCNFSGTEGPSRWPRREGSQQCPA